MDRLTEAIAVADLGSHMWSHPRLNLLLGLDFPTWVVAVEIKMSLKRDTRRDKLGSLGRLLIFVSISLVKLDQSTPFLRHLADLGKTGL